jgi:hypothetical protein
MREDDWFYKCLPTLKETWEKIKFFRENKEEAKKFKEEFESTRKKKQPEYVIATPKKNDGFIDSEE